MAQPVIYVATLRIKEGKFEEYQRFYAENLKLIEENEPRMNAFHAFANEGGTEVTIIQVHPDTASMDDHMQVLAEKMGVLADDLTRVYQFLEPVSIQVYGNPGDRAMEMDKPLVDAGVHYTFKPRHVGGFTRSLAS
ncbi:MAG: hypothetical protein ACRDGH_04695 [Candidatus Limnocylindria bacterium]